MTVPAQYLQIAVDVASRVAGGDLREGDRLYGRSVMASEYGVSPETIRRALRLLADMTEMTYQVDVLGRSADDVAREFLQSLNL